MTNGTPPTPDVHALIPPPPIVRTALARSIREARLLRRLLVLSIAAADERRLVRAEAGLPPLNGGASAPRETKS